MGSHYLCKSNSALTVPVSVQHVRVRQLLSTVGVNHRKKRPFPLWL